MYTKHFIKALAFFLLPIAAISQVQKASLNSSQIKWQVKPQAEVGADSLSILKQGYTGQGWVNAVVPGTVFSSYVAAGIEKDPNYGDNIHNVDRAKYDRSYWYRTEFTVPADFTKEVLCLQN